jgi:pyridoxine 5-phosphate synthase
MRLAVNIDHIATVRNARGGVEPDPVSGASICELAGAEAIICHLREDRRHITDRDVRILREVVQTKFELEMAATDEMLSIALDLKPDVAMLVPENRQEITTEGGLQLTKDKTKISKVIDSLKEKDIPVSLFIDPVPGNVDLAVELRADTIEIHTGEYANAKTERAKIDELTKIAVVARMASEMGLGVTAGHGLNYVNILPMLTIKEIAEVSIGHSIISKAVFTGLDRAVRDMVELLRIAY